MLDSSVHFVAGLRKVVGLEINGHVLSLCTSDKGSEVPVPTTLCGVMMLGTTGEHSCEIPCSVSITMASAIHKFQLSVTGTRGTLHVERDGPGYIVRVIEEGMKEVTSRFDFCGVERALSLFSSKVRISRSESRFTLQDLGSLSPFEGALDLAFIQSLIQANEEDLTKRVLCVREKYDAKL